MPRKNNTVYRFVKYCISEVCRIDNLFVREDILNETNLDPNKYFLKSIYLSTQQSNTLVTGID